MWREIPPIHRWLFFGVIFLNILLRFYQLGSFSLSNDELSAITRLDYGTFIELIRHGVIQTDPHPAGVQLFMYLWKMVFGNSAFAMRFPFVICGILSLFVLFDLFLKWFGSQNSLLLITVFSLLEFSIIHGQLARPYAIGIFLTSVFVWSWHRWLMEGQNTFKISLCFIGSGVLAMLTHYFAGLFVGIVAIAGLVPAFRAGKFRSYLMMNLLILAAFVPHLPITIAQFSKGQLTAWIQPRGLDFIWDHMLSVFNHSLFLAIGYLLLVTLGIFFSRRFPERRRFVYYSLFFALTPIAVGLIYAQFKENVLMDRVLYFSFPFLLAPAFAFIPTLTYRQSWISWVITVLAISGTTLFGRSFLNHPYTENFKGIAQHIEQEKQGSGWYAGNFNSTKYVEYYVTPQQVNFRIDKLSEDQQLAVYMQSVRESRSDWISLSWSCTYQPIEAVEYTRIFFPVVKEAKVFYNSGYWWFERGETSRETLLYRTPELQGLNANMEYANLGSFEWDILKDLKVLNIFFQFEGRDLDGLKLVWEFKKNTGESLSWRAKDVKSFQTVGGMNDFMASIKIPEDRAELQLVIYFWNPQFKECRFQRLEISSFTDSDYPNLY